MEVEHSGRGEPKEGQYSSQTQEHLVMLQEEREFAPFLVLSLLNFVSCRLPCINPSSHFVFRPLQEKEEGGQAS